MNKVRNLIHAVLSLEGFEKTPHAWIHRQGSFIQVITSQRRRSDAKVCVNLGVIDVPVYEQSWLQPLPDRVDETVATVRARLGELMTGRDVWWDSSSVASLQEMQEGLRTVGLEFLKRLSSEREMISCLEASRELKTTFPPPHIYLALLKVRAGDRAGGLLVLDQIASKLDGSSTGWLSRVEEVRRTLVQNPLVE